MLSESPEERSDRAAKILGKELSDEGQDEHESWKRAVGRLI
jgi:hypothetical protein